MSSFRFHVQTLGLLICSLSLLATIRVGSQSDDVAFVNVNVVPMDRERMLAAQTVWISGGRIKAMGAVREIALPRGIQRVGGTGK